MASQKGLGRGLGALLDDLNPISEDVNGMRTLPIQKIEPNPEQPRKTFDENELAALADSIAMHGVIQPITVRPVENGFYQIISGERRWRAARMAGLRELPALVMEADDKTVTELALIENLQREDLDPIEEAEGFNRLVREFGMTQEQAAERIGKSRSAVANSIRLLALPEELRRYVSDGKLTAGHARTLLPLSSAALQKKAAQQVMEEGLNVRQTELLVKRLQQADKKKKPKKQTFAPNYLAECEKSLRTSLGRAVRIVNGTKKGRIELEYYGDDDLQRLYELLSSVRMGE